jgi:hypothetical protein
LQPELAELVSRAVGLDDSEERPAMVRSLVEKDAMRSGLTQIVALGQGSFYVATGCWPLVHMQSFERVTGPKADRWLVQTAGVLITVIGATLLHGARRDAAWPELRLLGMGSAAGLAGIDLVFVARGRIPPVYLLDAAAEGLILIAWAVAGNTT